VFAGGVAWLTVVQPAHSVRAALAAGLYPFVLADLVKLLVAASVMPALWRQKEREPFRRA
jgi:biotin transporter BioY